MFFTGLPQLLSFLTSTASVSPLPLLPLLPPHQHSSPTPPPPHPTRTPTHQLTHPHVLADKEIDIGKITPGARVALRNDSYTLHVLLPTKVDPLVSLMKVEKVPDSTYDMVGGLDQQIKEIKEVRRGSVWVGAWAGG